MNLKYLACLENVNLVAIEIENIKKIHKEKKSLVNGYYAAE